MPADSHFRLVKKHCLLPSGALGSERGPHFHAVIPSPVENELFRGREAVAIAAGKDHAAAIDGTGTLFTWGSVKHGRLGRRTMQIPGMPYDLPGPVEGPLYGAKCKGVACGAAFTVAVDSKGDVYTWGFGGRGALGHGTLDDEEVPRRVEGIPMVASVSASVVCAAVAVGGQLYVWGENHLVGFVSGPAAATPMVVCGEEGAPMGQEKVREVALGVQHGIALGRGGRLTAWGKRAALPYEGAGGCVVREAVRRVACGAGATALVTAPTPFSVDSRLHALMLRSLYMWYVENTEDLHTLRNAVESARDEVRPESSLTGLG